MFRRRKIGKSLFWAIWIWEKKFKKKEILGKEDFWKRGFWKKGILGKGDLGERGFVEKGIWGRMGIQEN